ncbi:hypothetical protein [Amycolatopsis palatopharyngis]|uniref:hypothetical protein n=1 Tax=Amycolatopsis palatopharyngis TaxID=187982 RepID=UPI000E22CC33|nr:hypothetical protein [Amycolatopsis palatopharyngis]
MSTCMVTTCTVLDPVLDLGAYACDHCQGDLVRKLGAIETYLEIVGPERQKRGHVRGAPGYASASPADDHVIAMFDPRSTSNGGMYDSEPEAPWDTTVPVVGTIIGWTQILADEGPAEWHLPDTLGGAVLMLRTHVGWMCQQPWIDDAHDELTSVHHQLRAAAGDVPPDPIAMCSDRYCGGPVYWAQHVHDEAACARCGRPYVGIDLARLRTAQEER